jgi:2-polyprenyl-6-methoxyphenol hydroxylase-like FAD-dependent oxidoreductase
MLALLLARKNVSVTLLEAQSDFRRDFRGDTIHSSTLETLDELGLADDLLELPHSKIRKVIYSVNKERFCISDFTRIKSEHPYLTMMAQAQFLEFLVSIAKRHPNFRFILGARAIGLIEEARVFRGLRYETASGPQEVRALLTVGADGRGSHIRRLAGLNMENIAPSIHVLWFRIPRERTEPEEARVYVGNGTFIVALAGYDYWQLGKVIARGDYQQIRQTGLRSLRETVVVAAPEFADRIDRLQTWRQVARLSVQPARLTRWYRPGLLMIGDGAHVMSPVGGVGINYAIKDAVVTANVLSK